MKSILLVKTACDLDIKMFWNLSQSNYEQKTSLKKVSDITKVYDRQLCQWNIENPFKITVIKEVVEIIS